MFNASLGVEVVLVLEVVPDILDELSARRLLGHAAGCQYKSDQRRSEGAPDSDGDSHRCLVGPSDAGLRAQYGSKADYSFLFGNFGDKPVVGDWDGDGTDEIGLHRESSGLFYFRNTLGTRNADGQFFFGNPGDRFVARDWGIVDDKDTPAVFRPGNATFYFRYTNTQGAADAFLRWGSGGWLPVAGDFTLP